MHYFSEKKNDALQIWSFMNTYATKPLFSPCDKSEKISCSLGSKVFAKKPNGGLLFLKKAAIKFVHKISLFTYFELSPVYLLHDHWLGLMTCVVVVCYFYQPVFSKMDFKLKEISHEINQQVVGTHKLWYSEIISLLKISVYHSIDLEKNISTGSIENMQRSRRSRKMTKRTKNTLAAC